MSRTSNEYDDLQAPSNQLHYGPAYDSSPVSSRLALTGQLNPEFAHQYAAQNGRYLPGLGAAPMKSEQVIERDEHAEIYDLEQQDDVLGSGVFDPYHRPGTANTNMGVFTSHYSLPGYDARAIPFVTANDVTDLTDDASIVHVPGGGMAYVEARGKLLGPACPDFPPPPPGLEPARPTPRDQTYVDLTPCGPADWSADALLGKADGPPPAALSPSWPSGGGGGAGQLPGIPPGTTTPWYPWYPPTTYIPPPTITKIPPPTVTKIPPTVTKLPPPTVSKLPPHTPPTSTGIPGGPPGVVAIDPRRPPPVMVPWVPPQTTKHVGPHIGGRLVYVAKGNGNNGRREDDISGFGQAPPLAVPRTIDRETLTRQSGSAPSRAFPGSLRFRPQPNLVYAEVAAEGRRVRERPIDVTTTIGATVPPKPSGITLSAGRTARPRDAWNCRSCVPLQGLGSPAFVPTPGATCDYRMPPGHPPRNPLWTIKDLPERPHYSRVPGWPPETPVAQRSMVSPYGARIAMGAEPSKGSDLGTLAAFGVAGIVAGVAIRMFQGTLKGGAAA